METLNINAVEMVNNTVKLNNTVMGNIEELTKVFEQEEKELNRLVKRNRNEAVIAAQQKVVDEAKNQMEQAKEFERISKEKAVNSSFTFSVVDEETGARTEQQKKIAFVKNNRPVNSKKVDGFIALIAANKYDKAFPIIVMEASKLIEAGYTVTDINGKELTKEEAKDYFVILDGQHRSTAFAKLIATGKYQNLIPNVHVRDIENVGEYLVDINNVGTSWDKKDRLVVASLTSKLEHSSDKKEGIIKKKHTNKFIAFGQLMLLAMNVLKNSEEIHEENLKADSYTRILKNSISYVVLYKMICEEIINHFEEFPKERVEEFKFVLRFLPVIHQNLISDNLGTYKLAEVIKEKIEADKVSGNKAVISEFEKFLSVYLYCDIKGDGYKAIMGDFIKNINKTYIADSCFFKLLAYYYSSTTPSDDNSIVNLLADLYIKVNANKNSNKRINKSALIQKFKKEKAELE